jgi:hypothetical protein
MGEGVITAEAVGSTTVAVADGPGDAVGDRVGDGKTDGEGVGQGDGVGVGVGDNVGDTVGVGSAVGVGVGVGVIVGRMVMLRSVGIGRSVGSGPCGVPVGSREMLCRVRWLMSAPTSTSDMGSTYMMMPIKKMMARKFSSALFVGLPPQDGPVPDLLIL